MKFYATSLAVAALLSSDVAAVKLTKDDKKEEKVSVSSAYKKAFDD